MKPRGSILCRIQAENELPCQMARSCVALRLFVDCGIAMVRRRETRQRVFHGIQQAWSTRPPDAVSPANSGVLDLGVKYLSVLACQSGRQRSRDPQALCHIAGDS